jgi:FAD:protein FMN transferase
MLLRTPLLAGLLFSLVSSAPASSAAGPATEFTFFHENVLGTSLELRVNAESRGAAQAAEERVLGEIDRLAVIFNGYDPASELSRWQDRHDLPRRISPELFEVLRHSDFWIRKSAGAFDPRAEALTRLWSSCAKLDRLPTKDQLASARALMAPPAWKLDPASRTAERVSGCPISLNGIAKGYIVGRACEAALSSKDVHGVLLNVGGDMRVCGDFTGTIGVAAPWADSESSDPLVFIKVKDRSVATSGSSQRGFRIGGKWYSHVFDPRTGEPVERALSATVVAPRAVDADALAKACCVLEPEQSLRLIQSLPDTECLIVMAGGELKKSNGWPLLESPPLVALGAAGDPQAQDKPAGESTKEKVAKKAEKKAHPAVAWDKELEVLINFEINNPLSGGGGDEEEKGTRGRGRGGRGGRYRRPYVAVWVEDADGHPVRTLSLWVSSGGAGPFQWLPDLKRWYQADQDRKRTEKKEILFTVSRPTRPPGKYKIIWDGKDNNGKQLGGGEYTITIEAAREHGTYQSIRKEVVIEGKPFTEELKGNVEIKSASIEYRRKPAPKE